MSVMFNAPHRHFTFTIDEQIRFFFKYDRKMLDLLFKGADITLNYWRKDLNKKKQFKLGFIQVLHTFGKSMN